MATWTDGGWAGTTAFVHRAHRTDDDDGFYLLRNKNQSSAWGQTWSGGSSGWAREGHPDVIRCLGTTSSLSTREGTAMKFRVERDALADAVAWTAKSLPSRPSVPVLAGVLLRVSGGRLTVPGFDYEVSSQVSTEVQSDADGAALVSGPPPARVPQALPAKPGAGDPRG